MRPKAVVLFYDGGSRFQDPDSGILSIPAEDFEPIPAVRDVVLVLDSASDTPAVVTRRRVDLARLFRDGGRLIILLGPRASGAIAKSLGQWLSDTLQFYLTGGDVLDVRSTRPDLNLYLHEQVACGSLGRRTADARLEPLAFAGQTDSAVAARFQYENADIFLIPIRSMDDALRAADTLLQILPGTDEYPRHLDAFPLGNEADLRREAGEVASRLETVESDLAALERMKGILYKTGLELQHEVSRFLSGYLEIPARSEESNREDFWLLDDHGKEVVIGEVKGPGKENVVKGDVGALMGHRTAAGRPEDFPGLLVVNTLHRKKTPRERDVSVPADVVTLAAGNDVLVMRTLDLFRTLDLKLREKAPPDIRSEAQRKGGWLEVTGAGSWTHRES
jgi:hypothetical protein